MFAFDLNLFPLNKFILRVNNVPYVNKFDHCSYTISTIVIKNCNPVGIFSSVYVQKYLFSSTLLTKFHSLA